MDRDHTRERARVALERARAATPGPWRWWTSCSYRRLSSEATGRDGDVLRGAIQRHDGQPDVVCSEADKALIAEARTDVEDFAAHILRITSPEMRERVAQVLMENSAMNEGSAAKHARDVMALLTEEP